MLNCLTKNGVKRLTHSEGILCKKSTNMIRRGNFVAKTQESGVTEGRLQLSLGGGKKVLRPLSVEAIPLLPTMLWKESA